MTTSNSSAEPKCGNPYKILNLPYPSTSAQIKKAFRDLSLKLHPDKRKPNLSPTQVKSLDEQFIQVQEAKSFLLDEEFAKQRKKYDLELTSVSVRKEDNERKKREMSDSRRKFMSKFEEKERALREQKRKREEGQASSSSSSSFKRKSPNNSNTKMDNLQKKGKQMREEYNERTATMQHEQQTKQTKQKRSQLKHQQVRLKWSRAKMGYQSKQDIINLLSPQFGPIQDVELIGSKGNAALVTFEQSSSCQPCVDAYMDSKEMRATLEEMDTGFGNDGDGGVSGSSNTTNAAYNNTHRESMQERKLRQAAERERLLRQMEQEEEPVGNSQQQQKQEATRSEDVSKTASSFTNKSGVQQASSERVSSFPPKLPLCDNVGGGVVGKKLSYLERLEVMERKILNKFLSPDALQRIQITK